MQGLDPEALFYGVLAVCAAVLGFCVLVSVLQSMNERRRWTRERRQSEQFPQREDTKGSPGVIRSFAQSFSKPDIALEHDATPSARGHATRIVDEVPRFGRGLMAKMILSFGAIVAAFGSATATFVYFSLPAKLNEHALARVRITAVAVREAAVPLLVKNNPVPLKPLLRKHAASSGLAYLLVEDDQQRVFAHSFAALPDEFRKTSAVSHRPLQAVRLVRIDNTEFYEVSAPISDGRGGLLRLGVWRERIDQETRETMMPLMRWLLVSIMGGVLVGMFLAWWINRPIFQLVAAAKAISSGALETPAPNAGDTGELGELSRAIERLRSSVKAAMTRLK